MAAPATAIAGHNHGGGRFSCNNSAACQYVENVPGGGGPNNTAGGGGGSGQALPSSTQQALESQGSAGAGAALLANATAQRSFAHGGGKGGDGTGGKAGHGSSGKSSGGSAADESASDSGGPKIGTALGHVVGANDSGSGMGILLPIILGLSLVGAGLIVIGRRRGAHPV